MKEQRVYPDEFKSQAVEMAMQPGATKAGVARSLGVNPNTLAGWINKHKRANGIVDPPRIEDEHSENIRLRRELRQAQMEIEILKNAAAYFAKELRKCKRKYKPTTDSNHNHPVVDNAVAESFFGSLKTELIHNKIYATISEARRDIFDYVEVFYNRERLHSTLGYMSPQEYDEQRVHFLLRRSTRRSSRATAR